MKFKKPFHEKKIGKLLTSPLVKGGLNLIPLGIGSFLNNILDKNGTVPGEIDPKTMPVKIMKLIIYGILAWLALKGHLTWEDAEQAKGFINQ